MRSDWSSAAIRMRMQPSQWLIQWSGGSAEFTSSRREELR
jgi:hypothetical protein